MTIAWPSFFSLATFSFYSRSDNLVSIILFSCGYRLHQPNASSSPTFDPPFPHTPDSIRATTLQLSKLSFSTSLPAVEMGPRPFRTYGVNPAPTQSEPTVPLPLGNFASELSTQHEEDGGFIFPHAAHMGHEPATDSTSFLSSQSLNSSFLREIPGSSTESDGGFGLESSIESLSPSQKLSGLSLLRPDSSSISSFNPSLVAPHSPSTSSSSRSSSISLALPLGPRLTSPLPILAANEIADTTPTATPMGTPRPLNSSPLPSLLQTQINPNQNHVHWRSPRSIARLLGPTSPISPTFPQAHEQTPLLGGSQNNNDGLHLSPNSTADHQDLEIGLSGTIPTFLPNSKVKLPFTSVFSLSALRPVDIDHIKTKMKHGVQVNVPYYLMQAVTAVPAVLLGCLLNILDGVSCELFLFVLIDFQGLGRKLWYASVMGLL